MHFYLNMAGKCAVSFQELWPKEPEEVKKTAWKKHADCPLLFSCIRCHSCHFLTEGKIQNITNTPVTAHYIKHVQQGNATVLLPNVTVKLPASF